MLITNKYLRKLVWGIGFALFCAMLAGIYSASTKQKNKVVIKTKVKKYELLSISDFLLFFIMTSFAAIRLNVGSDYYNYYKRFNNVRKDMSLFTDILPTFDGYKILSYIVKQFTNNEYAIFCVVAIILYWFLFRLIKNEVEDKVAAFICYLYLGFFANSLNILKQCIAMMFVLCFYNMLREKKIVRSVIFALLAFLFHYSALFALVIIGVITILEIKPSYRFLFLGIISGLIFALFLPQVVTLLFKFVPSASGYEVYVDWRRNNQIRMVLAMVGMCFIYTFLLFVIVRNKDLIRKKNETRYYEITFLIIGLCINIASLRIWVVQRLSLYFYQYIILILPTMFQGMDPEDRKKTKRLLYLLMFIYLMFSGMFLGENEYYSYNTIFSGDRPIYDADFNKMFQ